MRPWDDHRTSRRPRPKPPRREVIVELPEPEGMHRMDIKDAPTDGTLVWEEFKVGSYRKLTVEDIKEAQGGPHSPRIL